jgi:ATPase subunit of ABC transporter with duplicated ATPase domains
LNVGNFALHPKSRDIKIDMLSITFYGREILVDTKLELNTGRRYGLIGLNGTGKSTLLAVIGNREVNVKLCDGHSWKGGQEGIFGGFEGLSNYPCRL